MSKVIILGARGRFGRAAVAAFSDAGWDVTTFTRGPAARPDPKVRHIEGDACNTSVLCDACVGMDLIVNALNPAYEDWAAMLPVITQSVIAAASACGATVLIPGNVYPFGSRAPEALNEQTPWHPTSRKGHLRVEMETAFRQSRVRTIVLRGGDFLEREKSGNWFDGHIAVKAHLGKTMYPGPLDRVHAWAYLPDMARAAVMLAEQRDSFGTFEEFCFEGYALTGRALVDLIEGAVGRPQKVAGLPWFVLRLLGLFQPAMREVCEMRYLWAVPHRLVGQKLSRTLPDFKPTPPQDAFRTLLAT